MITTGRIRALPNTPNLPDFPRKLIDDLLCAIDSGLLATRALRRQSRLIATIAGASSRHATLEASGTGTLIGLSYAGAAGAGEAAVAFPAGAAGGFGATFDVVGIVGASIVDEFAACRCAFRSGYTDTRSASGACARAIHCACKERAGTGQGRDQGQKEDCCADESKHFDLRGKVFFFFSIEQRLN